MTEVDRRLKPLMFLVVLGCTGAAFAAAGGSGTLIGGILCAVTLALFCMLYELGYLGPQLPPVRLSRQVLVAAMWILSVILALLLVLMAARYLSIGGGP
jgi:hypothetical protein